MVGLTGGIASGKSTVSEYLRALGATIIDADLLAREVVKPGTAGLAHVVKAFGRDILARDGALDRRKLGAVVFADDDKRRALEAILHPLIFARFAEERAAAEARGESAAVYDAALLFESGLDGLVDVIMVVTAPPKVQLARLMARDNLTRVEAEQRLASQMSLAEKAKRADVVIDNGGDREATRAQVEAAWREIVKRARV